MFPTVNDNSSKMIYVTIGVILLFFSLVGYFGINMNIYKLLIGISVAPVVSLFGFFESPKGWLTIQNNILKIYGVSGVTDIRQLKEIILSNDRITLVNIYGEHKNSTLLKLNPAASGTIKNFIETKLDKSEIQVIDNVTNDD